MTGQHKLEEVTLNQHLKHDGKTYPPGVPCELPVELVEKLEAKGKIALEPAATARAAESGEPPHPAQFTDEQRKRLLKASITMMVAGQRGLDRDGRPKVKELEADSGMNTNAEERDALFDELFPEQEEKDGVKKRPFLDRLPGLNTPSSEKGE